MAGPLSVHSRRVKLPFVRICYFIFLIRADRMPVLQLIYLFNLQEVTILRGLNYRLRRKKKKGKEKGHIYACFAANEVEKWNCLWPPLPYDAASLT